MLFRSWSLAFELVRSQGGRFIAILQPVATYGNARIDHLNPEVAVQRGQASTLRRAFYDSLRAKMDAHPYMYDMTDAFDGDAYLYIDTAHVSRKGNEIIAERLSKEVDKLPITPPT